MDKDKLEVVQKSVDELWAERGELGVGISRSYLELKLLLKRQKEIEVEEAQKANAAIMYRLANRKRYEPPAISLLSIYELFDKLGDAMDGTSEPVDDYDY